MSYNNHNSEEYGIGRPFLILVIAVLILFGVSFMSLSELSGGRLKDYNLLSDIIGSEDSVAVNTNTYIDPDLIALEDELLDEENVGIIAAPQADSAGVVSSESDSVSVSGDENFEQVSDARYDIENAGKIEDYTPSGNALSRFKSVLSSGRVARIAVIGDSYIEGDILTQNIREGLQEIYGGEGVGYVPAHSNLTGFRQSVRQSCSGWKEIDFRKSSAKYAPISGFYHVPESGIATTTLKSSGKMPHAASWSKSRFLFIAPDGAAISMSNGAETKEISFDPSADVQEISIDGTSTQLTLNVDSPTLISLGLYVDGTEGVAVDNMSIRGYSGIRHNKISTELTSQMRNFINYDIIVVEYGINALSSQQTDYKSYIIAMERAIRNIQQCYPEAEIIIMGIGDRGEKAGTEIRSMPVVSTMISNQREMARRLGVMFWDTRAAMGGVNSVVEWANKRDINKDYIHLSTKGGERLGKLFVSSIIEKINE